MRIEGMDLIYSPEARAELDDIPERFRVQIVRKIGRLREGLVGDIKALRRAKAGYRLRSGDFRILFDVHANRITIQHIKNRREAYE